MAYTWIRITLIGLLLAVPVTLGAKTFRPKTDNVIAAIDLRTGKVLWTHAPNALSDAHFEVYGETVVAYPHYDGSETKNPIVLTRSGKLAATQRVPRTRRLARSAVHWPLPPIVLSNGWQLDGFRPGDDQSLRFRDRKTGRVAWELKTGGYPHQVRAWKNFVFYAFSYLSDDGVLHAYRAGKSRPAWTFDINKVVTGRAQPLTRMAIEVIDDVLYIEANEHIFAVKPATGKLLWHRDVARELGLKFEPDLFGGALNLAVFARAGDVLIISFENRVIALDTRRRKYLWHIRPDTFPHTPYPVAHGGRLYLTLGKNHVLTRVTR